MSVVATEIVSDAEVGASRQIVYRCQDSEGDWHRYGPVYVPLGQAFDAEASKATVAANLASRLADIEAELLIGSDE